MTATPTTIPDRLRLDALGRIFDLSMELSHAAPPMKPFIRFAPGVSPSDSVRHWDFNDGVQSCLTALAFEVASPDELVRAQIDRWRGNLNTLEENRRRQLAAVRATGATTIDEFDRVLPVLQTMVDRLAPGSRFLYIGAGSGTVCLQLARVGWQVVGVDTLASLLALGRGFARHLDRSASFACMDVMALGLPARTFDGFFIEFYGSLPRPDQVLALQRQLARILKPDGLGFIHAARRQYGSYWFRMGLRYISPLETWLRSLTEIDRFFTARDVAGHHLTYGIYHHTHTTESLAAELRQTFDVLECAYEPDDPRYVRAVVRPLPGAGRLPLVQVEPAPPPVLTAGQFAAVQARLDAIARLCDRLADHHAAVRRYFTAADGPVTPGGCFRAVKTDLPDFIRQLDRILT
jgi:SAM-dependent methyltransferase